MGDIRITSSNGLISSTIKSREETYYLVTESNLKEINGKNSFSSIFVFLASIMWGAFFSNLITLNSGINLQPETIATLHTMFWVFMGFGIIFLLLVGYYMIESFKSVNNIRSTGEVILEPTDDNVNLVILKAKYGANGVFIDIAPELNKLVKDNKLIFEGRYNDILKDPLPKVPKILTIEYKYLGHKKEKVFEMENTKIELP